MQLRSSARTTFRARAAAAGVVALAALAPGPGEAQEPPTRVRPDSARALPPVTITGTRTRESVLDVPLAVTVVGTERLRTVSGYGLNDALTTVPGVLAQSRYGSSDVRIVIRGFGARGAGDRSNAGTSRGIRVLLDGFPETEPDGRTAFDQIDLATAEGVEVIRSNASSVWGNAAGGVIAISSVPVVDRALFSAGSVIGGFGLQRHGLRMGTKIGAGTFFASYVNTRFDGWRESSEGRRDLINMGVVSPLGERTELGVFAVATHSAFEIPGPLTMAQVEADPRQANATYKSRRERRDNRLGRLGVSLEHRIGDRHELSGLVYVNPKYLKRSERGTFRDFNRYHLGGSALYRNFASLGETMKSTFLVGTDGAYQDGAILFYSLTPQGTRGGTLQANRREGARNLGVFAQEELGLGERVTLTAGARYDDITYYNKNNITPAVNAQKSFTRVTPKLGVVYRLSPTHSLYANAGGGVEAPAGNETDPASTFGQDTVTALNPLLDPIRSTTYEVGTKQLVARGDGFFRALSYDVALYTTDVRNEIVPYRGGRFYFTAGKVRRSGAELGLTMQGSHGLSLQTAFTYSRNRYVDYVVDSVHYGRPGQSASYADNRVVGIPDFFYGATVAYAPAVLRGLSLQLAAQGTDAYFADDANTVRVPGYGTLGATLAMERPLELGGGLGLRGFVTVNNLADRRYVASAFLNPDVVNGVPVAFEPGLPRHVVASLSLGWVR
ncbi:MAG: TonB-dependent receptor [Gemmatimonadaceae bacterium]